MRALVCGAGIAGLALSQRLSTGGWDVTLVEKSPGPRSTGYMLDFFGPGYDAAEAMGVLPRLHELSYRVDEATYVDESGRRTAGLSFGRFRKTMRGRLLSILRPELELALWEAVDNQLDLRFGTSVAGVVNRAESVSVTLSDGQFVEADLLVGADGIHSTVREQVFGPEERFLRYLGFHTAAYVFEDPAISSLVANRVCLTDTVNRQMGLYGLRDGRVAVFTVHRSADATVPRDAQRALRRTYGSLAWVVPDALALCPPSREIYYDQVAQIEAPHWSTGRVTLVGDAAHAVSLLAGQGASLGSPAPMSSPSSSRAPIRSRLGWLATRNCGARSSRPSSRWPARECNGSSRRTTTDPAPPSDADAQRPARRELSCGHDVIGKSGAGLKDLRGDDQPVVLSQAPRG